MAYLLLRTPTIVGSQGRSISLAVAAGRRLRAFALSKHVHFTQLPQIENSQE